MRISTLLAGLAFVLAGVVMLLINLGFGSLDFALQLLRFWPVILIIIGLSLFGRGRINSWVAIVIVLALAGGVAAWLLLSAGHIPGKSV